MTLKNKIYIALAAFAFVAFVISLWTNHRETKLQREIENAKTIAEKSEASARDLEQKAAEYKQKIEYLEEQLSALKLIAKKQDEELKTLEGNTNNARHNVRRARAVRTIDSTTTELCTKLANLGHPCE